MVKKIKHDAYVKDLCEKIKPHYDFLSTNVCLFYNKKSRRKRRIIAEIDVLAVKKNNIDVYEVKCSNRLTKAKKQLKRIKRLMPHVDNIFFFCGDSGLLYDLTEEDLEPSQPPLLLVPSSPSIQTHKII
ncbi:MAG: hypothetical protein KKA62_02080 [Nanoarchaeota archaeon]|nr:hypothetical protein [Nanoarchaeota archaeon]MBU1644097.1 hypothetical protein [Nanoarchaeota archaeon]MBU1976723.1 hypothetical protein [Nanoarchaeota archaeon]